MGEVLPAIKAAEEAVKLCPNWWVGLQTLGRAQMGLGEVGQAVKTFSRAVHICPDQQELWREDLQVKVNSYCGFLTEFTYFIIRFTE